ncbi:MAG: hypothetical protein CM15mV2_1390 [uncultured marine virus]|nr:MAG: hypothetical protein CM15mV2_1390 [uncultured marine virus]
MTLQGQTILPLPANIYAVDLDADEHPEQAAALYGGIAGPSTHRGSSRSFIRPNPYIEDPAHFSEVYDMNSFGWDPSLNSGAGGWKTPRFSCGNLMKQSMVGSG